MKRLSTVALLGIVAAGIASVGCGGEAEVAGPELQAPTVMLRPLIDNVDAAVDWNLCFLFLLDCLGGGTTWVSK